MGPKVTFFFVFPALLLAGLVFGQGQATAKEKVQQAPRTGLQWKPAPKNLSYIPPYVAEEVNHAKESGGQVIVYVGAVWCEPCMRFKRAVKHGKLDRTFPRLRFLEFDRDQYQDELEVAGYGSKMIPLFCVPESTGKASKHCIQGSIKGPGAVGNIVPRLKALLSASRAPVTLP